ncbi:MAG TPA: AAA family ATPase [Hyphomicrobiaceae bacterium]|nr:AAA family ATPase [Hyphomicrobiaceae bacterium]
MTVRGLFDAAICHRVEALDYLIAIVIGLAAGWLLSGRGATALVTAPPQGGQGKPETAAAEQRAPEGPAGEAESLTMRLHGLEALFAASAGNCAHPRELADDRAFLEAVKLLQEPGVDLETVTQYALGANWALSCAGLAALGERSDRLQALDEVIAHFDKLSPWAMHFALQYFVGVEPRPPVGAPVVAAKEWWCDNVVIPVLFRDYFARRARLGDAPAFGAALDAAPAHSHAVIKDFLARLQHPHATALLNHLQAIERAKIDRAFLTSFGRFWADGKDVDILVEPDAWREALESAEAASLAAPPRSLLVSGDHRVGKTSFLRLLAKRLELDAWVVFEAGGADLMAGQQWFGQLEGRIQRTVEELPASKKLIWYIPDIVQIALSGTHQGQAASILDQILPALASGRLIVWAEASPAGTARLLRLRPALRGALEVVRLEAQSQAECLALAHALVGRLSDQSHLAIDPGCVEAAIGSARQFLNAAGFPGSVLDLIKLTASRAARGGVGEIGPHDVILTLSQLTGLPLSMLDNKERVDLGTIRNFFSSRVIGQDEAVAAVVERIAILKAGLNDPGKPIGVFLFAGPTGTGKTELAKTVAEYLFGSADRLIRLDMSEFQTPESTVKILGSSEAAGDTESLIGRVRKLPFSVVLLDEFEKAHANVWDLFLQVFDDGRLTDSLGHVADFRHCIIILTTNIGAANRRDSGLGFAPATDAFSDEQILRAISQTFRPEFQNRLDKVIVFHPLTRDLMRGILKKELGRVLERRGLKDREWAVEWEASAHEFLLEKGFSSEMGARPLKRAIDQYVIAPLATTIVEQRFPEGDQFVFVRSDGRGIQAEFVDPDRDTVADERPADTASPGRPLVLPAIVLAPSGSAAELGALDAELSNITQSLLAQEWEELKARLSDDMLAPSFWTRPDRHETLSRLALMDRVKAAASTAGSLRARLAKGQERAGRSSRELVSRLALQLHLIKEGIRDVFEGAPIEVALAVEAAFENRGDDQANQQWCSRLLGMYRAWAGNRHMQLEEIARDEARGLPLLLISGFGAHRLLAREVGLHVLELADDEKGPSRATARVRLAVAPLAEPVPDRLRAALIEALERAPQPHAVVRRYRSDPSPLVRNMSGSWRTGRLDAVLRGDFDLIAAATE